MKMKTVINAFLVQCILCYFQYFFAINVGVIVTYYVYSQWYLKKDSPHVDFNTHKETTVW